MRGYFGIGIEHPKTGHNIGTLWRSAHAFGAAFVFTVGPRRVDKQGSDTVNSWRHIPHFHLPSLEALRDINAYSCPIVGVEIVDGALDLRAFSHPERAIYLLGAEDHGLTREALAMCHAVVRIVEPRACLNVSVAGSIVMWDRTAKGNHK